MSLAWPIALIVVSNTLYQICAKSVPSKMNPFASLSITYLVAAAVSAILYFLLNRDVNLIREYKSLNFAPIVLGIVIVGLEAGYIYAYRVGWSVSTAQITQSAILAIMLIFVGFLIYKEAITLNKIFGVVICLVGLYFITK